MLNEKEIKKGVNILTPPSSTPWYKILLEKYGDPIIKILIIVFALDSFHYLKWYVLILYDNFRRLSRGASIYVIWARILFFTP